MKKVGVKSGGLSLVGSGVVTFYVAVFRVQGGRLPSKWARSLSVLILNGSALDVLAFSLKEEEEEEEDGFKILNIRLVLIRRTLNPSPHTHTNFQGVRGVRCVDLLSQEEEEEEVGSKILEH
jgi:hypothetical protein